MTRAPVRIVQGKRIRFRTPDKEWLVSEYVTRHKGLEQIAAEQCTTGSTVLRWLERCGVETRRRGQPYLPMPTREWLEEQYNTQHRTAQDIADRLGVSQPTVTKWLHMYELYEAWGTRGRDRSAFGRRAREILGRVGVRSDICGLCGFKRYIEMHHIDYDWRNNDLDNLEYLCRSCHSIKHNRGRNFRR